MNLKSLAIAALATTALAVPAMARDQIRVVGSSTVFPYSQAAAEEFANKSGKPAPIVESTGTGGGMKIFCQGVGEQHPDLTGASRAMKKSEWDTCNANGVTDISELLIGYDGIAFAVAKGGAVFDITRAELFLALAADVPVGGKVVANPYQKWSDIDPRFPANKIRVQGPPPTSGTRDAWVELVMEEGCNTFAELGQLSKDEKKQVCSRMRQDGLFEEAGENDNLIVQALESDKTAYGIFGYSFLYENKDKLVGNKIEGIEPTFETIATGAYPVSRPIFIYAKNAHRNVIPGMQEFIAEFASEEARAQGGYMNERGLVPAPDEARKASAEEFVKGGKMTRYTQ